MFYWDTYFNNKGLLGNNFETVAKWSTQNLLFVVDKFGYMGNAAITDWGMNRSQPPYLSEMVRDIFEKTGSIDTAFIKQAYPILQKEYLFWTDTSSKAIEQHNTPVKGLQRFYHHASDKELLKLFEEISSRFDIPQNISNEEKIKVAIPYAVEAATGMDFTTRFEHRCSDFIALELNCLLYTYEKNFAWMASILKLKNQPNWQSKAEVRKNLINQYCWDEARGMYFDYDFVNKRRSKVAAVTTFQPLWAGIATKEQAAKVVRNMKVFEDEWGLATTEKTGEARNYQWGEKSLWAPLQVIAVTGLNRYGFKTEAKRVASKYLDLITKNYLKPEPAQYKQSTGLVSYRNPGRIYEKYKIGGTINDNEYQAHDMMGWTAGAFVFCYQYLNLKNN
jgi:alpha,alpha-trehalase